MSVDQGNSFFSRLIAPILNRLKKIANSSRGLHTVDDLKAEAWLAAKDINAEQAADFQPEDRSFQDAIVSRLWKGFGMYADAAMHFAFRLDKEEQNDDGDFLPNSIGARLTGPTHYQPLEALELSETQAEQGRLLEERYAEAIAYLRTLDHFDSDKQRIANHLSIAVRTVGARVDRAAAMVERQPSLFDGIESIPLDFVPLPGRPTYQSWIAPTTWAHVCLVRRPRQDHIFSTVPRAFTIR
jgi:hypothetical protein